MISNRIVAICKIYGLRYNGVFDIWELSDGTEILSEEMYSHNILLLKSVTDLGDTSILRLQWSPETEQQIIQELIRSIKYYVAKQNASGSYSVNDGI